MHGRLISTEATSPAVTCCCHHGFQRGHFPPLDTTVWYFFDISSLISVWQSSSLNFQVFSSATRYSRAVLQTFPFPKSPETPLDMNEEAFHQIQRVTCDQLFMRCLCKLANFGVNKSTEQLSSAAEFECMWREKEMWAWSKDLYGVLGCSGSCSLGSGVVFPSGGGGGMTSPLLTDPHLCPSLLSSFLFAATTLPFLGDAFRLNPWPLLSVQLPSLPLSPTSRLFPPDSLLLSLPKGPRNLKILFSLHLPLHVPVGAPPARLQPVFFSRAGGYSY